MFQILKDWRARTAKENGVAHFQVLHQRVLVQIAVGLPDTTTDLKKIKGIGKKLIEKYGEEILSLVVAYRKKYGIDRVILPEPKEVPEEKASSGKAPIDSGTRQISFELFNKGFTIARIAEERGLVESTIQGHLCFFIENGQLDINRLLSPEKQGAILSALTHVSNNSLKEVKKNLGDAYSYGDIKLMLAHQNHSASK